MVGTSFNLQRQRTHNQEIIYHMPRNNHNMSYNLAVKGAKKQIKESQLSPGNMPCMWTTICLFLGCGPVGFCPLALFVFIFSYMWYLGVFI